MDNLVLGFSGTIHEIESDESSFSDGSSLYRHSESSPSGSEGSFSEESDFPDTVLKFISQMLMEEDMEEQTCMLQDCMALQVAEKSFYDVLAQDSPNKSDQSVESYQSSELITDSDKDEKYFSRVRKSQSDDFVEKRSSKYLAPYAEEQIEQLELFDDVLLCNGGIQSEFCAEKPTKAKVTRSKKGRNKNRNQNQVLDLETILTHCAQAVANNDVATASEQLKQIRQHSSPYGDASQRLAHYFADALEARMAGTGAQLYTALAAKRASAADILMAYKLYVAACPFKRVSQMAATMMLTELSKKTTTLHIIDFGILYGYQWPCIIQQLSKRPGGPPKLRITGIDLPQPGFRPAERIEETGRRLRRYCERFEVPFEYTVIAKKWETVRLEDLKIDRDDVTVVNSFYRLQNVPDIIERGRSPRDMILKLIRKIDPHIFIHAVANGSYNASFFSTRFREALFHFSAMFDIFEANVLHEDRERMSFEKEILGKSVMNVIACEGLERVDRPETYRQWEARSLRAGLRLVPLKEGIVEKMRTKVQLHYHKNFLVDEDGGWMLQGWKGRILNALSCWKRA